MTAYPGVRLVVLACVAILPAACASRKTGFKAPLPSVSSIGSADFRQGAGHLLGAPFVGGNRITTLVDGDEIFPAMLRAIRSARRTITFETYVFEEGEVPRLFAEALAERARAGVQVHVVIDGHGGKKSRTYRRAMREAGVQLEIYRPLLGRINPFAYNNRTHRKLLIIDGRIGFIGGVGIADEWKGRGDSPEHWHDLHYRVEGPVVAQLQASFMENWLETTHELLQGPGYFPPLPAVGSALAGSFRSSPEHDSRNVELTVHLAIASARRSLLIENAYFVPDDVVLEALIAAARRGVRVQILLPGEHIDQKSVRRAARARYDDLLAAGVEIYEYEPTMPHSKLLIADGLFTSVGSANFDYRSLHINDEANLNVLDAAFAAQQTRIFQSDLSRSRRVTEEKNRGKKAVETPARVVQKPVESQL